MPSNARPLALVTGASGGIGADLARELARDGHDLVLTARSVPALESLAEELRGQGANVTVLPSDLAASGAADALMRSVEERGLSIDVLVNNAGFGDARPFVACEAAKLSGMIQLNVVALTELTRLFVRGMIERGRGKILLVASTAAYQPDPGMAVYGATKAYVLSLGEALACELSGTGVTVTTLCPGPVHTGFAAAAQAEGNFIFARGLVPVMRPDRVAALGYRALKKGRRDAIPGLGNKIGAWAGAHAPRWIVLPIARMLMAGREQNP